MKTFEMIIMMQNAKRYEWLSNYLVSLDTSKDDAIVGAMNVQDLNRIIDGFIKEDENDNFRE